MTPTTNSPMEAPSLAASSSPDDLLSSPFIVLARRACVLTSLALLGVSAIGGGRAVVACAVGLVIAWAAHLTLARGIASLFHSARTQTTRRMRAVSTAAFTLRHGLVGVALFILVARLPVEWLALGLSAWPAAYLVATVVALIPGAPNALLDATPASASTHARGW